MSPVDLADWLRLHIRPESLPYAKRLSANDTLATGAHQAGPYVPKDFLFAVFPALNNPHLRNPDVQFSMYIDSHGDLQRCRAIWYNNRLYGGTRNETRITGLGGRSSAFLDPENTGALVLMAFPQMQQSDSRECHAWVCPDSTQEDIIETQYGTVEPGGGRWLSSPAPSILVPSRDCYLALNEIPMEWRTTFPSPAELVNAAITRRPYGDANADVRLLRRRACEYELFKCVEMALALPFVRDGFTDIEVFLSFAQTVLQRRKARSGISLELHVRTILLEERFVENVDFSWQRQSDPGRVPDFLFPSASAYRDNTFPDEKLRMLAVKTTCKDRWRQVLQEARRIRVKHLLTLQEGVSEAQFAEMMESGVRLVVPAGLHTKYPRTVRRDLASLETFLQELQRSRSPG